MGATARLSWFGILKNQRFLSIAVWTIWTIALSFLVLLYWAGGAHRVYAFHDYMQAGYHWIHREKLLSSLAYG